MVAEIDFAAAAAAMMVADGEEEEEKRQRDGQLLLRDDRSSSSEPERMMSDAANDTIERLVSFGRGEVVEVRFRNQWVDARILGPASQAGYDVRYEDGGHVERGVAISNIRRRAGWSRWREGDEAEIRRKDGKWSRTRIIRGTCDGGGDVEGEDDVPRSRLRPVSDLSERAMRAAAAKARFMKAKSIDDVCSYDSSRATPVVTSETLTIVGSRPTALEKKSLSPPTLEVRECAGSEMRQGDELLSVDGVEVGEIAAELKANDRGVDEIVDEVVRRANNVSRCSFRVKRFEAKILTEREKRALELAWGAEAPRDGDAELAVVVDAVIQALRIAGQRDSSLVPDPDRAFAWAVKKCGGGTSIDIAGFKRYLSSIDTPGRLGKMSSSQVSAIASLFDRSGDGVVSKNEFQALVYGRPRSIEELRQSLIFLAGDSATRFFDTLDADHNGVLGKSEILDRLAQLGLRLLPIEAATLFEDVDADRDGVVGLEELKSFLGMTEPPKKEDEPKPAVVTSSDEQQAEKRDILAEYIVRCDELELENAKLRRSLIVSKPKTIHRRPKLPKILMIKRTTTPATYTVPLDSVPCDERDWPSLEQRLGGVNGLAAAQAVLAANRAWQACRTRTTLASLNVARINNRAQTFAHATHIASLRAEIRMQEEARARVERDLTLELQTVRRTQHRREVPPPPPPHPTTDDVYERQLKALSLENKKLQHELQRAGIRERGVVKAWRLASRGRDDLARELRDAELNFQAYMREARLTVEYALQRAEICEFKIQDARLTNLRKGRRAIEKPPPYENHPTATQPVARTATSFWT